jgi:hypothetical protein
MIKQLYNFDGINLYFSAMFLGLYVAKSVSGVWHNYKTISWLYVAKSVSGFWHNYKTISWPYVVKSVSGVWHKNETSSLTTVAKYDKNTKRGIMKKEN